MFKLCNKDLTETKYLVLWRFFTHHSVVACKLFVEAKKQYKLQNK